MYNNCYRGRYHQQQKPCYREGRYERPQRGCDKYEDCIVICDETVYCVEEVTYDHCVKHIVPIVCKKIENHVYHHEYEIEKKYEKEERCCEVGKRKEDWCKYCDCKDEKPCDFKG